MESGTQIWHPELYIGNDVETQNLLNFGQNSDLITSLWYFYPKHRVRYSTIFTAKIACSLGFQTFPFDSHTCLVPSMWFWSVSWSTNCLAYFSLFLVDQKKIVQSQGIFGQSLNFFWSGSDFLVY